MTTDSDIPEKAGKRRINFDCDAELFEDVEAYRFEGKHPTLSEAYMTLWRLGLVAFRERSNRIRKGEPEE